MPELIPEIRNTARAVIIHENHILLLKKAGTDYPECFVLPGGGQDTSETLHQALIRECEEEIGAQITVGELLHVADYFKIRDTRPPTRRHLVEFLFFCHIDENYTPHNGPHPDKHQVDVMWVALQDIPQLPLSPPYLHDYLPPQPNIERSLYLGSFHAPSAS